MPVLDSSQPKNALGMEKNKERLMVIGPGQTDRYYWLDLFSSRELLAILAWRDFAIRYKQTALGVAWAAIRPLVTIVILTVVFGHIANLRSDGRTPYILMVSCGMLAWFLMSTIFSEASNGLINNADLISKVYFPRLVLPLASVFVASVDFAVSFLLTLVIFLWFGFWPDWRILCLPLFIAMALVTAFGPALFIASLNVKYRDFRNMVPFLVQFGLYISPVGFSSAVVPEHWRIFYSLNPAVGVIEGFRWCLLGGEASIYFPGLIINLVTVGLVLIGGLRYFRSTERNFADLL
jgi:lipopolysaccharide transport system permease protein